MPRIGVLFELRRAETVPGEGLRVVGARPELGAWDAHGDTELALQLRTSAVVYPRWLMRAPVWLEVQPDDGGCSGRGTPRIILEYKFVKDRRVLGGHGARGAVGWEEAIENRRASLPCMDGTIWLISDAHWNSQLEPTQVSCTTMAQVRWRWNSLESEWAAPMRLRPPEAAVPGPAASFLLTPREEAPSSASHLSKVYAIEEEFQALSPDFRPPGRQQWPSPVWSRARKLSDPWQGSSCDARMPTLLAAREEEASLRLDNLSLREALHELREENAALRRMLEEVLGSREVWPPAACHGWSKAEKALGASAQKGHPPMRLVLPLKIPLRAEAPSEVCTGMAYAMAEQSWADETPSGSDSPAFSFEAKRSASTPPALCRGAHEPQEEPQVEADLHVHAP